MTIDDYLRLITSEHREKPLYAAVLSTLLQPMVDAQNQLESLIAKFDVDYAVGEQLDFVGEWVGFSRKLRVPLAGVYFSFDTAGLGFDEGVIFGPGSPTEGVISLDDETYRLMIYAKIAANIWDGTLRNANVILADVFAGVTGTHIFIQDNTDMSIDIGITGTLPSALFQQLIEDGYFDVKPAAVRINAVHVDEGPFFGFDTQNYNISGFDTGILS